MDVIQRLLAYDVDINAMDGECRNYVKTKPLDDENLLRMLAATMVDAYCTEPSDNGDVHDYESCPHERGGMDEWITRTHLEPVSFFSIFVVVVARPCLAHLTTI